jgi:hypothetical protein
MYNQARLRFGFPLVGTAFLLMLVAAAARADDKYYMIMFGAQDEAATPRLCHTFATFVKASGEGDDKSDYKLERHTISWIPATREIVIARLFAEPGENLGLRESLRLAASQGEQVAMWGPFEIKKELYDRARKQIDLLEKGEVQYKAIDARFRPTAASNCIHAVADIDTDNGYLSVGTAHGAGASRMVLDHLSRWIIKPDQTHEWVGKRLGLDDEKIIKVQSSEGRGAAGSAGAPRP